MLQFFRDNIKSGLFIFIIILIVASFALFGMSEFFSNGQSQAIATIDGEKLERGEYEFYLRSASAQMGKSLSDGEKKSLVEEIVKQRLLAKGLSELNLRPSDQTIATQIISDPEFQVDGQFNQERYAASLKARGYSPAIYEDRMRESLAYEQFANVIQQTAIADGVVGISDEMEQSILAQFEARTFSWVPISIAALTSTVTVTDADIQKYYDEHAGEFALGEGVKLDYIHLSINDFADTISVSAIEQFYQDNLQSYSKPDQFDLAYLTVTRGAGFDTATVSQLHAIVDSYTVSETDTPEVIADYLAASLGDDFSIENGSLGIVDATLIIDLFGNEVSEVISNMTKGELTVVQSDVDNYQVLVLTEKYTGEVEPLSAVQESIEQQLKEESAAPKLFAAQETLQTVAFESPSSLAPSAEALGTSIKTSEWIYADGSGDALLSSIPEVITYAFDTATTTDGYNSDIIAAEDGMIVVRLTEKKPASQKPLAEVSDQIRFRLDLQKVQDALAAAAASLQAEAMTTNDPVAFFKEKGLTVNVSSELVDRATIGEILPATLVAAAFSQPEGFANATNVPTQVRERALLWVDAVEAASIDRPEVQAQLELGRQNFQNQIGILEQNSLTASQRERARVEINESQL